MVENKYIQTEEYILKEEQQKLLWEKEYGEKRDLAIGLMNESLLTKSRETRQELIDLLKDEVLVKALSEVAEIAFIFVIMDIYEAELKARVNHTILDWAGSLDEVIDIIRQIKFLLWEIEFLDSEGAGELLLGYLQDMNISMPAFEYIVFISSYDKRKMVEYLEGLFA